VKIVDPVIMFDFAISLMTPWKPDHFVREILPKTLDIMQYPKDNKYYSKGILKINFCVVVRKNLPQHEVPQRVKSPDTHQLAAGLGFL